MPKLLAIDRVTAGYGDSIILEDVSLDLDEAGSLALLGRNGVGKTTLLLTLMGMTRVKSGTIAWCGADVTRLPTFRRAHAGIGWVPQERFMFASLSVDEHLSVVARPGPWTADRVYRMFPQLQQRKRNLGSQLSGGEQQMVAIARALMTNPKLLLLDEPMEGLAPIIVQDLMRLIGELVRAREFAVIVVEQHARLALQLTEHAIVLDRGRIVHRSRSDELLKDPESLDRLVAVA
ncbi:MAG: ABC transporter ATP-binding protein [Betaproteobacteria bacterium]